MNSLRTGSRLSHYRITDFVGRGGMGEVYKALDTSLGRTVAIKVLPPTLARDDRSRRRLLREARTASLLSHPNICTIFEVNEQGEQIFVVLQYLSGRTLKEILSQGPLPVPSAIRYAVNIADALDEAHRNGVIHRDIKPSNILINERDQAVVLDFGLAKQIAHPVTAEDELPTLLEITGGGAILGTVAYMSPEQVRGEELDGRTDVFSLGISLYEVLAGSHPFLGANAATTMHSILEVDPAPLSARRPELGEDFDQILMKSLAKDRGMRYESASEFKSALVGYCLEHEVTLDPGTLSGTVPTSRRRSRATMLLGAALALVIAIAGWMVYLRSPAGRTAPVPEVINVPLDNWRSESGELISTSTFSPDGKLAAYSSTRRGDSDIWVKQVGGGEPINITQDGWTDRSPVWSPDGQQIAYVSTRAGKDGIYRIPSLGGTPTLIMEFEAGRKDLLQWSRDDRQLFYELNSNLYALDVEQGTTKQLTAFDERSALAHSFRVSPSGDRIVFVDSRDGQTDLWVASLDGTNITRLTDDSAEDLYPIWHPDGRRVVYSSNREGTFGVRVVSLAGGAPQQITFGDTSSLVTDISPDGSQILFVSIKDDSDLWGVNVATGVEFDITRDVGVEMWADVSPDGGSIVYQSVTEINASSLFNSRLKWKALTSGVHPLDLSSDGFDARWSPDGKTIAFIRFVNRQFDIWSVSSQGGRESRVTRSGIAFGGFSTMPYNKVQVQDFAWSPDGKELAFGTTREGLAGISVVSADGSNERSLITIEGASLVNCPIWSADGNRLCFTSIGIESDGTPSRTAWVFEDGQARQVFKTREALRALGWINGGELLLAVAEGRTRVPAAEAVIRLLRLTVNGGRPTTVGTRPSAYLSSADLSRDGTHVALVSRVDRKDNLSVVALRTGAERRLTSNADSRNYFSGPKWSPDGRAIYFSKQSRQVLVSMYDNFK